MGLKGVITQSNYIPWRGYFHLMDSVDIFVILDEVQYTKRDWRNRNFIQSNQGLITLTIPVKTKGKYYQTIYETEIAEMHWKRKHLNAIYLNYKKAAAFEQYYSTLAQIYDACETTSLSTLNVYLLREIASLLGITTEIVLATNSNLTDRNLRLINICDKLNITEYHTGISAMNYMDLQLFEKAGIQVVFHNYQNMIPYPQHSNKFVDKLSIIDTILHCGDDTIKYLHPKF